MFENSDFNFGRNSVSSLTAIPRGIKLQTAPTLIADNGNLGYGVDTKLYYGSVDRVWKPFAFAGDCGVPCIQIKQTDIPKTISLPGTYCVAEPLTWGGSGAAITINSSNVEVVFGNFSLTVSNASGIGVSVGDVEFVTIHGGEIVGDPLVPSTGRIGLDIFDTHCVTIFDMAFNNIFLPIVGNLASDISFDKICVIQPEPTGYVDGNFAFSLTTCNKVSISRVNVDEYTTAIFMAFCHDVSIISVAAFKAQIFNDNSQGITISFSSQSFVIEIRDVQLTNFFLGISAQDGSQNCTLENITIFSEDDPTISANNIGISTAFSSKFIMRNVQITNYMRGLYGEGTTDIFIDTLQVTSTGTVNNILNRALDISPVNLATLRNLNIHEYLAGVVCESSTNVIIDTVIVATSATANTTLSKGISCFTTAGAMINNVLSTNNYIGISIKCDDFLISNCVIKCDQIINPFFYSQLGIDASNSNTSFGAGKIDNVTIETVFQGINISNTNSVTITGVNISTAVDGITSDCSLVLLPTSFVNTAVIRDCIIENVQRYSIDLVGATVCEVSGSTLYSAITGIRVSQFDNNLTVSPIPVSNKIENNNVAFIIGNGILIGDGVNDQVTTTCISGNCISNNLVGLKFGTLASHNIYSNNSFLFNFTQISDSGTFNVASGNVLT